MRISYWSSDVCSSDLGGNAVAVIDVRTGTYTTLPISPEDAKQIRGASWNGAGDVEIELPNQRLEFRKRARDWVFLGADSTPHAQAAVTVAVHQNANTPPALYAVDNRTGLEQMILDLNPRLRTDFSLGRVEFVHWKDQEGGTWEGRLFYPVGYRQNRRYPLVIQTHVWGRREDFTLYGRGSISPTLGPGRSVYLRSEEHTSELQSLMRISYAVFCLTKQMRLNLHSDEHN